MLSTLITLQFKSTWLSIWNRQLLHFLLLLQQTWQTCCDLKMLGALSECFQLSEFVLKCFPHRSHCNLNQCDLSMWKRQFTHFLFIQFWQFWHRKIIIIQMVNASWCLISSKWFPHRLHWNLNLYDYPCGKDSSCIWCCYYNKLGKHVATSKSLGALFNCFLMSELVLKCFPHELHRSVWFIHVEKTVYKFCCYYNYGNFHLNLSWNTFHTDYIAILI